MKKRVFGVTVLISLLAFALGLDFLFGTINEVSTVREHARQFRSEAAPLEISTRALVPNLQHRYLGDGPSSGGSLTYRWLRTNNEGLVVDPTSPSDGNIKILFLGGSTTETNEVEEPFRFPTVVGRKISEAGHSVLVKNGGVRGNTTQDSINTLLNRPGFRDAQVVVLMENINDRLKLALRGDYSSSLSDFSPTSSTAVLQSIKSVGRSAKDWLVYRSNILFALDQYLGKYNPFVGGSGILVNEKAIDFQDIDVEKHVEAYQQNLVIFASLVRALGAEPMFMTQALGVPSRQQTIFNEAMRRVASAHGVHLIDLDSYLGESATWAFFEDKIHLNNTGSEAVGDYVAASILATEIFDSREVKPSAVNIGADVRDLVERCNSSVGTNNDNRAPFRLLPISGRYPSFSTDGRYLLFQTFENGFEAIRVLDIPAGQIIAISPVNQTEDERHPVFLDLANGEFRILFGSGARSRKLEKLTIREWPSGKTYPLEVGGLGGAIPAVSKNSIVFPGFLSDGPQSVPNLYRVDRATGAIEKLLNSRVEQWRPAIGPNEEIYFIAGGRGDFDLFKLENGKTESERFESSSADEWDPAVSPDGKSIAYASRRDGTWDLFLKAANSSEEAIKIANLPGDEWDPSFHPGGKLLVYAAEARPGSRPFLYGMCVSGVAR
jgi:lysophospholipase L1-like esterase